MKEESNRELEVGDGQQALDLQEDAAPQPVGVYDRPEQSRLSPAVLTALIIVIALIAAIAVFAFLF